MSLTYVGPTIGAGDLVVPAAQDAEASGDSLLLESGDGLLLESGDLLLMED